MDATCVYDWQWISTNIQMQYASRKETLFSWYSVVLWFCCKVSCRLDNIVCRTWISAVCVCWIHNMYCVQCVRETLGIQRRYSIQQNNGKGTMKLDGYYNWFQFSSKPRLLMNGSYIVTHIKMLCNISSKHHIIWSQTQYKSQCWLSIEIGVQSSGWDKINGSWGLFWKKEDEWQHAVVANLRSSDHWNVTQDTI